MHLSKSNFITFISWKLSKNSANFAPLNKKRNIQKTPNDPDMKGIYTILLLIVSNSFMTFAWYGHLKMKQEFSWFAALPLIGVIAFSWLIAFFEYIFMVPANRIGFHENGGPFSLMQLKVIQEAITLVIFTLFTVVFFKGEALHWNHFAAFCCLILAVYFVFMK